jgi:hypothetical protein
MFKRDLDLDKKWHRLQLEIQQLIGRKPKDLNGVLFLIGVQELGQGRRIFSKEEKQDLLHIAICRVLSPSGYYTLEGLDAQGWPHWRLAKKLPNFDLLEQEKLLKMHVLEYFESEYGWALDAASPPARPELE